MQHHPGRDIGFADTKKLQLSHNREAIQEAGPKKVTLNNSSFH